ncbi:unnamed protein product [Brassicogethes aeneus]|uniref:Integrase core domain-containing protein n=1 Tax=Brassicogethes aeneus TaxID=1431903 RepID=A0A9P0BD29_BRAAE|nr:unnamed protein product [Brassicogethes aeneus]
MLETLQSVFRDCFGNRSERPSHIKGRSTANQRIESWWSILRKENAQYWINLLESIRDEGLFTGSYLDKALIQFCFMDIVQSELDEICFQWNTHRIRRSRNAIAPTGRPTVMFELPENYGYLNYLITIPIEAVNNLKRDAEVTSEVIFCDRDVENVCMCIMAENGWTKDGILNNAISLYANLRNKVLNVLQQI